MFGKRKRPWKKYARIERIEMNNGDVKFKASNFESYNPKIDRTSYVFTMFENMNDAEAHLDGWWAEWWPKQVKRTRRA